MTHESGDEARDVFRVDFVAGVSPDKWARRWAGRVPDCRLDLVPVDLAAQLDGVRDRAASMALVRLPVDRDGLHVIPLYEEVPVVVAGREHVVAAFDEVDVADLADEVLVQGPDAVPEWRAVAAPEALARSRSMPAMTVQEVVGVVASGTGVAILPLSLARLHHRKDVVHRPVHGVAGSGVGLAWRVDDADPRVETFVGIVRGRTERSSRGTTPPTADSETDPDSRTPPRARPARGSAARGEHGPGRRLAQRGAAPRRGGRRGRRRR
jgi:hypothetical protein